MGLSSFGKHRYWRTIGIRQKQRIITSYWTNSFECGQARKPWIRSMHLQKGRNLKNFRKQVTDIQSKFLMTRGVNGMYSYACLAKSIVIEAAELLECFQWSDKDYDLQHVKEELADVIVYSQNLLDKLGLDADEIVTMKMNQNEAKYPVEKAKGSAAKYDQL